MPAGTWESLIGAVIEGRYRLRTLTYSGRDQAEYAADPTGPETTDEPLTVTLIAAAPDEMDAVRSQLLVASRLQHPGLVRILSTGEAAVEGQFMLYLASETPGQSLADVLASGPFPRDAVSGLALPILDALSFIHEQGLVYRALDPQTTVRAKDRWKLADFGRICSIGERHPELPPYESPYWPPESTTDPVSAAWDIWAFGILLRQVLSGQVAQVRRLAYPFDDIVEGCLRPQPEVRLSIPEIRSMLDPRSATATQPVLKAAPGIPATAQIAVSPHYPKVPQVPAVWRLLRILALIALVCLALVVPFTWRKKTPAAPPAPTPAAAARHSAPIVPGARPSAPRPSPAGLRKAELAKADVLSRGMDGRLTASGERVDGNALTASTRIYPLGARIRVTNLRNRKTVVVRVNDRGRQGRFITLTERGARELGISRSKTAEVLLEAVK
jgi:rare lipoprotein A